MPKFPEEWATPIWLPWWRRYSLGGWSRRPRKGKVAHLSASRNRQPSWKAHQKANSPPGTRVLSPSLPEAIVPDVLVELGQVQQQRSRRLLASLCCRHHHRMCPSRAIARLALAAPEVGRVVIVLPLLRQRLAQARQHALCDALPDGLGLKTIMCAKHKGLANLASKAMSKTMKRTHSSTGSCRMALGVDTVVSQASSALVCLAHIVDLFERRSWQRISSIVLVGELLRGRHAPVQPQWQPRPHLLDPWLWSRERALFAAVDADLGESVPCACRTLACVLRPLSPASRRFSCRNIDSKLSVAFDEKHDPPDQIRPVLAGNRLVQGVSQCSL